MAAAILSRLRTMPGSASSFADFARVVARDLAGVEVVEGTAVVVALVQDGGPAQAGLGAFQNQELEEDAVVMLRHAPFLVVVLDARGPFGPGAAGQGARRVGWVHKRATVNLAVAAGAT